MNNLHYFQIQKIYIGVDSLGEAEYHVEASVNRITGVGKTLEEAFEDLRRKLQCYVDRVEIEGIC